MKVFSVQWWYSKHTGEVELLGVVATKAEAYKLVRAKVNSEWAAISANRYRTSDPLFRNAAINDGVLRWEIRGWDIHVPEVDMMNWLEANVKETILNPRAFNSEFCPDLRLKWVLPTLVSTNAINYHIPFRRAVALAIGDSSD